jgi:hypothetical protein
MAQQAANAQAIIDAANAAAAAAAAQPLPGAQPAIVPAVQPAVAQQAIVPAVQPAIVPFAAWPGLANNRVLNFEFPHDLKYFNKATSPLTTKFDLKSGNIKVFLE